MHAGSGGTRTHLLGRAFVGFSHLRLRLSNAAAPLVRRICERTICLFSGPGNPMVPTCFSTPDMLRLESHLRCGTVAAGRASARAQWRHPSVLSPYMITESMRIGTLISRSGPCATSPRNVRESPGFSR
jgi:hypothetical protein